ASSTCAGSSSRAGPRAAGHRVAAGPTIPSVRCRRRPHPWGTDRPDTKEGPGSAWPCMTRHADPPGPSEVAPSVGGSRSVDRVAAGAGTAGVRVVGGEALLLDRAGEVDGRTAEVGNAHPVDDDLDAVELADRNTVEEDVVEVDLGQPAGVDAGLDGHAQAQIVATFLFEQAPDLVGSGRGELHLVSGLRIFSHSHGYSFSRSCPQATPG